MDPLDHASSYRLLCPVERCEKDEDHRKIRVGSQIHQIISSAYLIADAEDIESYYIHSLIRCTKNEGKKFNVLCWACLKDILGTTYYKCNDCDGYSYHKECVESPSVFQSVDHPKHPLQLIWYPKSMYEYTNNQCASCGDMCGFLFYYCSICDFKVHSICAKNPTSPTIENQKMHEHTLHYFPRRSAIVCDVCGLEENNDLLYVCLICDFLVHKRCISLPYVIKVSRHHHRLIFTPNNIPYKEWNDCGVCHAKINGNYGKYSCMKGCTYAVHSKCAMRSDVCDGRELEGVPEKEIEDIKMFQEEGDGIIRHLSHQHHQMQLDEKKIQRVVCGETKHCQACRLPFNDEDGNVYQCMQCDFILHEACAYLPREKQSMIHVHPLILDFESSTAGRPFTCRQCYRYSCGFKYVCRLQGCNMKFDILCASLCDPFYHHSHPHPLFITYGGKFEVCSICQRTQKLNCMECSFHLCFRCAMLPHKVKYEHDEHLVTFFYEKDANDEVYWCEICEEDINPKKGLYGCNVCNVTLHIECLLGRDPYIKPGQMCIVLEGMVYVLPNTSSTRPICKACHRHLSHPGHQMQLQRNIQRAYNENKHYCQACTLPFYDDGKVYQCVQCDFMLHELCAELPRVKQFMIHVHPLILKTGYIRWFICRKCNRYSRGFRYVCPVQGCDLVLDTLCASICEPYI